jgi:hypothetical protein
MAQDQMLHFNQVYVNSPDLDFNLFSLFSGHPASQSVRNQKKPVFFSRASRVLTQTLAKKRYKTLAFVLDSTLSKRRGFAQGFDQWVNPKRKTTLKKERSNMTSTIQNLKLNRRSRFFNWIHLNELDQKPPKTKRQQKRLQKTLTQFDEQFVQLLRSFQNRKGGKKTALFVLALPASFNSQQVKTDQDRLNQNALQAQLFVYLPKVSTRLSVRLAQREKNQPLSQRALTAMLLDLAEIETYDPARERLRLDLNVSEALLGDPIKTHTIYSEIFDTQNNLSHHLLLSQNKKIYHTLKTDLFTASKLKKDQEFSIDLVELGATQKESMRQTFQNFRKNTRLALPKLKD